MAAPASGIGGATHELKRSWVVLLACCAGASVGAAAFPLFLVPVIGLRLEQQFGWSRLDTSSLTSIAFIGGALGVPIAGWLNDTWSIKRPILISLALIGGLLLLAAIAPPDILAWQIGIFLFMLLGAATLSASFCKIICAHFHAMRGLALGLTIGSVSLVSAVALPWFGGMIDSIGTQAFFVRAGIAYFVVIIPLLAWLLPASRADTAAPTPASASAGMTAAPSYALWLLGLAGLLLSTITGSAAHLAALAADGDRVAPAVVGSAFAAGVLISRPLAGFVIDHLDARRIGAAAAALAAAGLIVAALFGDRYILISAVLLATAVGAEFDIVAFLASHYVAASRFGRTFSWMYSGMLLSAASGPVLIALLLDMSGSYRIPFLTAALLAAAASAMMLMLPSYRRDRSRS